MENLTRVAMTKILEDYAQLGTNVLGGRAVSFKGRRTRIAHRQAVMDELHTRALAEQGDDTELFEQILTLEVKPWWGPAAGGGGPHHPPNRSRRDEMSRSSATRRRRIVTVHLPGDGPNPGRRTTRAAASAGPRPAADEPSGDLVYVGDGSLTGLNCTIGGRHGTTTGVWRDGWGIDAVFVKLGEGPMLHCLVSRQLPDGSPDYRRVIKVREVDRDEFDRIIGADEYRRDCGWRGLEPLGPDPDGE